MSKLQWKNYIYIYIKNKFKDLDISKQYLSDIIRNNNITHKRATFSRNIKRS